PGRGTARAQGREPHPMLAGGRGTISYGRLARDGVRLLGRLHGADGDVLCFGPGLAENMTYATQRSAGFKRVVDEYVARTGFVAGPPDSDPLELPLAQPPRAPEGLSARAERIGSVIWCTGFGPDTSWLKVPVLSADGHPAHTRGITAFPGLYVAGFPWLSTRGSGILYGVAADALRIAQHIAGDAISHSAVPAEASGLSAVPT